jgi:SAM-dependent methyltransferase
MTFENQEDIVRRHYATDENLRIRIETHDKYTVPDRSFADWVLDRITLKGNERILDIGSGPGLYYRKLQKRWENLPDISYIGMDLVPLMLENHPAKDGRGALGVGNVERLPFANNSFDMVMANHMLYHVNDIHKAVKEMRRILKPEGSLVIATNSVNTMPELQVLMRRAIVLLTRGGAAQVRAPELPSDRFALENGTRLLSQYFYAVVRHDLPSALVFPEVEPAMAYLESTRDLREKSLPPDVVWDDVMMIMRQQINQLVKHLGELVINKATGVLIASEKGGFIGEFVEHRNGAVKAEK